MVVTDKEFKKLAGRMAVVEKKFKTMDSQVKENKEVVSVLTKKSNSWYRRFSSSRKVVWKRLQILEKQKWYRR